MFTSNLTEQMRVARLILRVIHNWNLLLGEEGLGIYLWYADSPMHGYKPAANYCQHYHSRYGNSLNGPSRTKILEIVRFMFMVEAIEESNE
jgi:hypothetical protein